MFYKFLFLSIFVICGLDADALKKGEKIYTIMCNQDAVSKILYDNKEELIWQIKDKNYCSNIDDKKLNLVANYLTNKDKLKKKNAIQVPKNSKCPVCGMLVAKYPKWVAIVKESDGNTYYFDGVKDMMKYYFNPKHFHHQKKEFKEIVVSDYYTLTPMDAKKSWFVIGSNIFGPMGNELIPFKSKEEAKTFSLEHFGKKIISFDEISEDLVYSLD